jgi:hypothetical protein
VLVSVVLSVGLTVLVNLMLFLASGKTEPRTGREGTRVTGRGRGGSQERACCIVAPIGCSMSVVPIPASSEPAVAWLRGPSTAAARGRYADGSRCSAAR